MPVDFGTLNLEKIRHVIYDLDNCLYKYPDGFVDQFSVETACSARRYAQAQLEAGNDDSRLKALLSLSPGKVVAMARQSYADYGCTTKVFEKEFGIHDVWLYRDHHTTLIDKFVNASFHTLARHGLRQAMVMFHNLHITQHLYTNGTEDFAHAMTHVLGVHDCLKTHVGIDSYDDFGHPSGDPAKRGKIVLGSKTCRWAWCDAIELMQIPTYVSEEEDKKPFISGQEKEEGQVYKYWDYSHGIFFDDTPANLKAAKELGFQTVLVKTDRVKYDPETMPYIDAVAENLDVFLAVMAHEIETNYVFEQENGRYPRLVVSN